MPGRVRAGPDADDAGRGDRALEGVVLEVVVEEVGDRHREHPDHLVDLGPREAGGAARLTGEGEEVAGALRPERRRFAQHHRPQELGDAEEAVLEGGEVVGVVGRDRADRVGGLPGVVVEDDRAVFGHRGVGRVEGDGAVAEVFEPEVGDDLRLQHRDDVGGAGDPLSRPQFLGHAGAAEDRPALENDHTHPVSCEICRGRQPVVPTADHDRVIGSRGARARDRRARCGDGLHRAGILA